MPTNLGSCSICPSCVSVGPSLHDAGSIGPGNCSGSLLVGCGDPCSRTVFHDLVPIGLPHPGPHAEVILAHQSQDTRFPEWRYKRSFAAGRRETVSGRSRRAPACREIRCASTPAFAGAGSDGGPVGGHRPGRSGCRRGAVELAGISRSGPRQVETPSEELLLPWADQIYQWIAKDRLQLTRIHEPLTARGCGLSYQSLRRFVLKRNWRRVINDNWSFR